MKKWFIFISLSVLALQAFLTHNAFPWFWKTYFITAPIVLLGIFDILQTKHTIMSTYPIVGRFRYWMEDLRPKIYQYFVESDTDGTPISRIFRSVVYQRAKDELDTTSFGTQLDVYDVDLDRLLNELLKGLLIPDHIQISTSKLPVVKGDKYRLQQLFQNLISNAINYNDKPQGSIEIGYQDNGDFHQFFVKDNGMGIDEVYFDRIFKTFESLENNSNSTGIGLSIVKKIIDLYQGKIWVGSEIGKGTVFHFTLKK